MANATMPQVEAPVETGFRTLEVWPPIEPQRGSTVRAVLLEKMGETALDHPQAADGLWHETHGDGFDDDPPHSSIHIPLAAIRDSSRAVHTPNLITYTELVAATLGLKHMRYGLREGQHATHVFAGFSAKLMDADLAVCLENGFRGPSKGNRLEEAEARGGKIHEDGSVTFQCRMEDIIGGRNRVHRLSGEERVREAHRHVLNEIAPHLEEGVVVAPISVPVTMGNYPSLFTPESA